MKVRHDPLHPRPVGEPVRVAGRDPCHEPNAGLASRFPVVWGVADEERLTRRGAGLSEDLPDALRLRLRRAVDPDEVLRKVPAAGDLVHLGLRSCRDDVEREHPGAVPEEVLRPLNIWDGEHSAKDQPDVLVRELLLLLRGEGFVEDVCVDVAELVIPGHPAVLEVEGDDLVEVLGGREGEDLSECDGL